MGDSRHPLYYLILSSLVNIALDLLFVGVFHWGVWSAALATSISQFVSLGLCIFRLCHYDTVYRVCLRKIRFHLPMLKQVIHFGLPSGVQNSITVSYTHLDVYKRQAPKQGNPMKRSRARMTG